MWLPCSLEVTKLYDTPNFNAPTLTAVGNNSVHSLARVTFENVNDSPEGDVVSDFVNLTI